MTATGADRNNTTRQAADIGGRPSIGCCLIPQLTEAVGAPALHTPGAGERAGMAATGADRNDPARESGHIGGRRLTGRRTVPQFAVSVETPALHGTRVRERTGVAIPTAHGDHAVRQPAHVHR